MAGRGGGGGPGTDAVDDETVFRLGCSTLANFPASGNGGGALNLGRGGDGGAGGGLASLAGPSALADRLGAGGGGGAPRLVDDDDDEAPPGGGGGGGGALAPFESPPFVGAEGGGGGGVGEGLFNLACSCRKKSTINSWLSLIKSSVRPLSVRSCPKCSLHNGSKASSKANCEGSMPPFIFCEDEGEW